MTRWCLRRERKTSKRAYLHFSKSDSLVLRGGNLRVAWLSKNQVQLELEEKPHELDTPIPS